MIHTCPLCSDYNCKWLYQDSFKAFGESHIVDYYCCSQCALIFQDQSTYLDKKDEKIRYEEHNNSTEDKNYILYLQKSWGFAFLNMSAPVKTILDFGCGPAEGIKYIAEGKYDVESFDPHFFPNKEVLNQKHDLIFCIEAMEHFYNPYEEISKIKNMLKSGGYLMVRTGVLDSIDDFPDWWYHRDPTHVCFFSPETLKWIASEFGFKMISRQGDQILYQSQS